MGLEANLNQILIDRGRQHSAASLAYARLRDDGKNPNRIELNVTLLVLKSKK